MKHTTLFQAARVGVLACGLGLAPIAALAQTAVGHVSTLTGQAVAQQPGQPSRPLACGDALYPNDRVVTARDSQLGVLMGDALTELAARSTMLVGLTPDEMADVRLERGSLRLLDPREEPGAPLHLAALDAEALLAGNDTEAYVFSEKVGPYAMLCEWDTPLDVTRGDERSQATPGRCVIAKPKEPLYQADAHEERIAASPADACNMDVASRGVDPWMPALSPTDVSAGPPPLGAAATPQALPFGQIKPCGVPGSGCLIVPLSVGGGRPIIEPPPSTGGFPGSSGTP